MKKYGEVVTYVRNGVELNALVVQSNQGANGEELVMIYLDPLLSAVVVRDMSKVAAKTFAVQPFVEGSSQGWKDKADTSALESELSEKEETITQLVIAAQTPPTAPDGCVISRPECAFKYCATPDACKEGCSQRLKTE